LFSQRRPALFRRGILKHLILRSLSEGPKHGYEMIKNLSEELGGFYRPSTGAIYPLLRTLEDQGYITVEEQENKRVYSITPKGKEFLEESGEMIKDIIEKGRAFLQGKKELNREIRSLASLIMTNYRDLTPEKDEKIAQILRETRRKITEVVFE